MDRWAWPDAVRTERPGLFATRPWQSMAEALGRGHGLRTITDAGRGAGMIARSGVRAPASWDKPAPTIIGRHSKPSSWAEVIDTRTANGRISTDRPAPTVTAKASGQWIHDDPATSVMADSRIRPPGHHVERQPPGTIRVSHADLGVLQGFPSDFPWRGPGIGRQIGNAIPVQLATAILRAVIDPSRP